MWPIFILLFALFSLFLYFFFTTDSTFNLWFWMKYGTRPEAYFMGKTVWIVGASSGIGESLSLRLSQYTCNLILSARREHLLKDVGRRCKEINKSCNVEVLPLDILKFDEMKAKVLAAEDFFGTLPDIVILNSGVSQRAEWTEVDPLVDEECFRMNALAPTVLTRHILRRKSSTSSIHFTVVSSIAGIIPTPLSPSYCSAKAALISYFNCLSLEMGSNGVSVSLVCPGLTFSPNNVMNAFTGKSEVRNGEILTTITPGHMTSDRCAQLICSATANRIHLSFFAKMRYVLILGYMYTIVPGIANWVVHYIGVDRLRKIRTGGK